MLPENIDDLFRDKLDGHATPPADALWARLQAGAAATPDAPTERLDELFRQGLNAHATPPGRALWERLEDEHLRPNKRRAAAWWPMAIAAALALLLVAGGAGLWLGFPFGRTQNSSVATGTNPTPTRPGQQPVARPDGPATATANTPAPVRQEEVAINAPTPAQTNISASTQKNVTPQATRSEALASTAPKARMSAAGQSPRYVQGTNRQPDAATQTAPLVARVATRPPAPTQPTAPDETRPTPETGLANLSKSVPAAEIVPAGAVPATSLASAGELITVDVRNGGEPVARPGKTSGSALAAVKEPRRLGGRLLQQAGNLVRGERVSLAEATGLPQNVTLQATIGGRTITKSIQL
ncbi:hypothetical protein [Hymenobacter sp. IS2118]|uniref:hypothetical protein n=1 Tax=Hymenobacter sp. IS2118 TaxID=1505605 RepID=UPI0005592973|nr:hypothetical protein [Hymenobacter sp. IS2118]